MLRAILLMLCSAIYISFTGGKHRQNMNVLNYKCYNQVNFFILFIIKLISFTKFKQLGENLSFSVLRIIKERNKWE